ncbi:ADP-ribosylation factor-binding protein GGA1 isoform X3 [Culex quinquefasciatus]|uniref:ADP-ribosylation factor-binding protein GGA1 isoform X3 n=1 Tax=Culex quinquefasciatus TaxID=7176 RepID=UPI0018E2F694|nr:ADP-ribosylation factor-binding protein GGA1 isoform X3 [Culex quinquefasciatus]
MDATTKVLDGYLRKAVNPGNADLDVSALDQFCMTIKNDPKLMALAPQLLAVRIQSGNSREALLALEALEECMETCGREFRSEINKFRFLNELIKLVSKKFDGDRTPREVSERILNILLTWTTKYDNCAKIQEAYKLLKTQGIEHHPQQNVVLKTAPKAATDANRGSLDEKEFAKLRQLINSSKQEDRDKANLLIQNFYRDDERRTQMKHRRLAEVQKAAENTKLLDDMLSQYRQGETTEDELAIYRQIYESCEGMHPTIVKLAEDTQHSEGMLEKIFEVNDSLTQVMDRYRQLILHQAPSNDQPAASTASVNSPSASSTHSKTTSASMNITGSDPLDTLFDISTIPTASSEPARSVFEDLSDIFSATTVSPSTASIAANGIDSVSAPATACSVQSDTILTPLVVNSNGTTGIGGEVPRLMQLAAGSGQNNNKYAELKNLKPALDPTLVNGNGIASKKPSSTGTNSTKLDSSSTGKSILDLDFLVSGIKSTLLAGPSATPAEEIPPPTPEQPLPAIDDDDKVLSLSTPVAENIPEPSFPTPSAVVATPKPEFKSLAEIVIDLDNIQPSQEPSRTVLDDKAGLQITLNFAADHPRPDVTVIVISTINQGRDPIPSFHFDASVRKPCKLRLLDASGASLPGTKPFRPPADGVTQVLLLANPSGEPVDLTCILTYCVGDDPDPVKESIVMKDVPFVRD